MQEAAVEVEAAHPDLTEAATALEATVAVMAPPKEATAPVVTREVTPGMVHRKTATVVTVARRAVMDRAHKAGTDTVDSKVVVTAKDTRALVTTL